MQIWEHVFTLKNSKNTKSQDFLATERRAAPEFR